MKQILNYSCTRINQNLNAFPGPGNDGSYAQKIVSPFQAGFILKSVIFDYSIYCDANQREQAVWGSAAQINKIWLRVYGSAGNTLIDNIFTDVNPFDNNGFELQIWQPGQYFYNNVFFSSEATFSVRCINVTANAALFNYFIFAEIEDLNE